MNINFNLHRTTSPAFGMESFSDKLQSETSSDAIQPEVLPPEIPPTVYNVTDQSLQGLVYGNGIINPRTSAGAVQDVPSSNVPVYDFTEADISSVIRTTPYINPRQSVLDMKSIEQVSE